MVGRYKAALYCSACAATVCRTCHRQDGTHSPRCYSRGAPARPPLPYRGLVTEQDIADLLRHWPVAVRLARHIIGGAHAEDVVAHVLVDLLARRDYAPKKPTRTFFLICVRHQASQLRRSAWVRHVVAMDPEDLEVAELMTYSLRVRRPQTEVRLPEGPEERDSMGGVIPRAQRMPRQEEPEERDSMGGVVTRRAR